MQFVSLWSEKNLSTVGEYEWKIKREDEWKGMDWMTEWISKIERIKYKPMKEDESMIEWKWTNCWGWNKIKRHF